MYNFGYYLQESHNVVFISNLQRLATFYLEPQQ